MRITKLFQIGLENEEEANKLEDKLRIFSIQDNGITYNGFINFDKKEELDKVNAIIYTYLELDEFRDIVYECSDHLDFFLFDR